MSPQRNGDEPETHWSARAVSWAHLLIALGAALASVAAAIVANEARLTRLEERVALAAAINASQDDRYYRTVAARNAEYEKLRNEVNTKLDKIDAEVVAVKIAISAIRNTR